MAYKALYRIYRPQTFDEVVGQKYILQTLRHAITEHKIAHAYLFTGPRGTGKTTMAKLLAKGVNCTGEGEHPCNHCPSCLAIAEGSYPDVIEIDAASNNGVDEVRDLIDKVKYAPIAGAFKVYIIDEVHMMSPGAFNALLKTLEEPPAHVIFILATTEVHKVLPTIISRCQRFDFGRVSISDIKKRIQTVLEHEHVEADDGVVHLVATLADGGMRDALGILDQAIAYAGNHLTPQHIRDIYGIATMEDTLNFISEILKNDVKASLQTIERFDEQGLDLVRLTSMLVNIFKEVILFHQTKDEEMLQLLDLQQARLLTSNTYSDLAFTYIDLLTEALGNYRRVNTPRSFFELAVLKMCHVKNRLVERTEEKQEIVIKQAEVVPQCPKKVEVQPVEIKKQEEVIINNPVAEKKEMTIELPSWMEAKPVADTENETVTSAPSPTSLTENNEESVVMSKEEMINILVQATKQDKDAVVKRWGLLNNYMIRPNFAAAARLLIDGTPMAVASNGMIICFTMESQANLVNIVKNQAMIQELFLELLSKEYVFFATSDAAFQRVRLEFLELRSRKMLPDAMPITPLAIPPKKNNAVETNFIEGESKDRGVEIGESVFGSMFQVKGPKS